MCVLLQTDLLLTPEGISKQTLCARDTAMTKPGGSIITVYVNICYGKHDSNGGGEYNKSNKKRGSFGVRTFRRKEERHEFRLQALGSCQKHLRPPRLLSLLGNGPS
mmetsp:Transcript_59/g.106  ORF Transcript_59/g.106 Transcript_59/m.106 type:complete len:106 (-) Transcript_59:201-518(-)